MSPSNITNMWVFLQRWQNQREARWAWVTRVTRRVEILCRVLNTAFAENRSCREIQRRGERGNRGQMWPPDPSLYEETPLTHGDTWPPLIRAAQTWLYCHLSAFSRAPPFLYCQTVASLSCSIMIITIFAKIILTIIISISISISIVIIFRLRWNNFQTMLESFSDPLESHANSRRKTCHQASSQLQVFFCSSRFFLSNFTICVFFRVSIFIFIVWVKPHVASKSNRPTWKDQSV